jgi:hypothetical protein
VSVVAERRFGRRAYTRSMAARVRHIAAALIVFAVSGAPAAVSACMATCMGAMHQQVASPPADSSGRALHHHGPDADVSAMGHLHDAEAHTAATDGRIAAICHNCCPDHPGVSVATVTARSQVQDSAVLTPVPDRFRLQDSFGAVRRSPSPGIRPPASSHAPLILRI